MLDEQSFLDFKCPHCGEAVSFPGQDAGRPRACPSCMDTFIVPTDGSDTGRKLPLPLDTPRLLLRRFTHADWKDLLAIMSDEELFRYSTDGPLDEEGILRWLDSDRSVTLTTPGQWFFLGFQLKESGMLIGYAGLNCDEYQADLFIRVAREYHKKAIALEAMEAVLDFCFQTIRRHRVTAVCDGRNAAACQLFARLGLRREGEFIKSRLVDDQWVNTVHFAALDEEWEKASSDAQGQKP